MPCQFSKIGIIYSFDIYMPIIIHADLFLS